MASIFCLEQAYLKYLNRSCSSSGLCVPRLSDDDAGLLREASGWLGSARVHRSGLLTCFPCGPWTPLPSSLLTAACVSAVLPVRDLAAQSELPRLASPPTPLSPEAPPSPSSLPSLVSSAPPLLPPSVRPSLHRPRVPDAPVSFLVSSSRRSLPASRLCSPSQLAPSRAPAVGAPQAAASSSVLSCQLRPPAPCGLPGQGRCTRPWLKAVRGEAVPALLPGAGLPAPGPGHGVQRPGRSLKGHLPGLFFPVS